MQFGLFIVLNAALLIRPDEVIDDLRGMQIYMICICLCTVVIFPRLVVQLSPSSLQERPITVCIFGLLVAMALSMFVQLRFEIIDTELKEFAKVILYFLLLMAVVDTPKKMIAFMGWLIPFIAILATLGLLQLHGFIDVENLRPAEQKDYDPETGEITSYPRLCSTGIYGDPNDLCLILTTGCICCFCRSSLAASVILRVLWLLPIGLFFYAMTLTQSRGGLLGFLAGVAGYLYARYGWKKCIPLVAICVPAMIAMVGGRQGGIDAGAGTAQERMQLWAEGISLMLHQNPITGIGVNEYAEAVGMGLVAHNSFVHAYVEMGLLGGSLFVGAFYLAVWGLWRSKNDGDLDHDSRLLQLQPFLIAMVVGYAGGAYSVSRNYVIPTYMILGFPAAFMAMTYNRVPDWFQFDKRMVKRLAIVGLVGFVFLKMFTQAFVQYG